MVWNELPNKCTCSEHFFKRIFWNITFSIFRSSIRFIEALLRVLQLRTFPSLQTWLRVSKVLSNCFFFFYKLDFFFLPILREIVVSTRLLRILHRSTNSVISETSYFCCNKFLNAQLGRISNMFVVCGNSPYRFGFSIAVRIQTRVQNSSSSCKLFITSQPEVGIFNIRS